MPLLNSDHQSGLRLGLWPSPIFMIAEAPAPSGDASPGASVPRCLLTCNFHRVDCGQIFRNPSMKAHLAASKKKCGTDNAVKRSL